MTQQTVEHKTDKPDFFTQAADNFRSALEAGIRFQQDAFRSMTGMFIREESFEDTRQRIETMAIDSINLVRRNAEQSQRLFDEGCKAGLEVLRKSISAFGGNGHGEKDFTAQTRELWSTAFDALRTTVDAAAKTSTQAIENWSSFMTKAMNPAERRPAR